MHWDLRPPATSQNQERTHRIVRFRADRLERTLLLPAVAAQAVPGEAAGHRHRSAIPQQPQRRGIADVHPLRQWKEWCEHGGGKSRASDLGHSLASKLFWRKCAKQPQKTRWFPVEIAAGFLERRDKVCEKRHTWGSGFGGALFRAWFEGNPKKKTTSLQIKSFPCKRPTKARADVKLYSL